MRWTLFFDRSRTNKNIKITLKKKKKEFATIFWTIIETCRTKHPQTRAIKRQYTGEFFVIELRLLPPRSNRWISFQFSSTRYSSYAALEMETYYLPGEIRPFPDHVNYGNCRLLARANSPKSALCPPDSRVVLLVLNPLWTWPPATRIVARRVSTFLGLISFCYCSIITNDSNNSCPNDLKLTIVVLIIYRENCK